jgi:uncharacterized protein YdbL (DUF1318 family)
MFNLTNSKKVITLAAATLLTGCGYAPLPVAPTSNTMYDGARVIRQQAVPQLPQGVTARSLSLEPATAVARVGESLPLRITVKGSDNKAYTDPRLVTWTVSNAQLGVIDQNGVLRPEASGTLKIVASINGLNAEATVQIDAAQYAWQQVMSPTNVDLHTVKMITRYEAWAGGDKGTLLHYVNGAWNKDMTFRQTDANIRGLAFANSNLGWAVGTRGTERPFISIWSNGRWTTQSVPVSEGTLNAVSVVNSHNVWAVGEEGNGDALILNWDGKTWRHVQAPVKGKLNDIQMLSGERGFAVGKFNGPASTPLILKFKDGQWEKSGFWNNRGTINVTESLELKAIKMVSETQGYAVGTRDPLLFQPRGLFLTYEPKRDGWINGEFDGSVKDLDQVPLYDLEMISGTEGWALGQVRKPDITLERNPQSIFGNLLRNDGGVLKLDTNYFSGNLSGAFRSIDLLPQGEGFVVGERGYILHRTYDWRGTNAGGTYGSTTGEQNNSVTYGPGGNVVPGTEKQNQF